MLQAMNEWVPSPLSPHLGFSFSIVSVFLSVHLFIFSSLLFSSLLFSSLPQLVSVQLLGVPTTLIQSQLSSYVCGPFFWWCTTLSPCHPPPLSLPLSLRVRLWGLCLRLSVFVYVCAGTHLCMCMCARMLACASYPHSSTHTQHVQYCTGGRHRRPASTCGTLLSWRRRGPRSPGAWTCPI
jgi:hypothetical protein